MRLPQLEERLVYAETDEGTIEFSLSPVRHCFHMSIHTEIDGTPWVFWQDIPAFVVAEASEVPAVFAVVADTLRQTVRSKRKETGVHDGEST